jgi:hypothetical protein
MALAYEITPSGDHVQIVGCGVITTAECIGIVKHVMTDPRHRADSTALIDLRDVVYAPNDMADIIDIAQAVEAFRSLIKNKIAIVANHPALSR